MSYAARAQRCAPQDRQLVSKAPWRPWPAAKRLAPAVASTARAPHRRAPPSEAHPPATGSIIGGPRAGQAERHEKVGEVAGHDRAKQAQRADEAEE